MKADTRQNNPELAAKIAAMPKRKGRYVEVKPKTYIFIPDGCDEEERKQKFLAKIGSNEAVRCYVPKAAPITANIDNEKLKKMLAAHRTYKEIAKHFDTSDTTIRRYMKENNIQR